PPGTARPPPAPIPVLWPRPRSRATRRWASPETALASEPEFKPESKRDRPDLPRLRRRPDPDLLRSRPVAARQLLRHTGAAAPGRGLPPAPRLCLRRLLAGPTRSLREPRGDLFRLRLLLRLLRRLAAARGRLRLRDDRALRAGTGEQGCRGREQR